MKILLLADCNSIHTIKWATSLVKNDVEIVIFSLGKLNVNEYNETPIKVVVYGNKISRNNLIDKILYLKVLPFFKRLVKYEKPDILHAHYATSYGLLGALSNFHPFILSVWGSDIFEFPKRSFFHKKIIEFNFNRADKILSTSQIMAKEASLYTKKRVDVTPFGIDTVLFAPIESCDDIFIDHEIVIGTIKSLEKVYGIDYLIKAFKLIIDRNKNLPIKLLIVGGGSEENELKKLVNELNIRKYVFFIGKIDYKDVPLYHNIIDIFVALSLAESFGVAIVEASSCEKPVVVADVGGLPEVVEENVTGFVVPPKDEMAASNAIEKLVLNKELRRKMGQKGRERVTKLFNWDENVKQMLEIYSNMKK